MKGTALFPPRRRTDAVCREFRSALCRHRVTEARPA